MPMHTKNETCWLFGTFTLDDVAAQRLLSVLPDFVELRATQGTPVEWLEVSSDCWAPRWTIRNLVPP